MLSVPKGVSALARIQPHPALGRGPTGWRWQHWGRGPPVEGALRAAPSSQALGPGRPRPLSQAADQGHRTHQEARRPRWCQHSASPSPSPDTLLPLSAHPLILLPIQPRGHAPTRAGIEGSAQGTGCVRWAWADAWPFWVAQSLGQGGHTGSALWTGPSLLGGEFPVAA